ncbi:cytochrome c oxidase subunit 2A [Thalassobacillus pellis]|uniref:cytochrome c oxidase subunit 2A n=1 Tax=Thalassobacillus pellis TaxID=748008 RepID=UPI001EF82C1B|nr:cytochrome c oxidase subunit 2A [Thalassobacillus pellis]MBM7553674.1 hypothetical protein [Thalassobacillus pellis]
MKAMHDGKPTEDLEIDNKKSLKGTLFSVGVVGAVIIGMWAGVFWLYMARL